MLGHQHAFFMGAGCGCWNTRLPFFSCGAQSHFETIEGKGLIFRLRTMLGRKDGNPRREVAKPHRRRGVSAALLRAAVELAARQGAQIVEGYPVDLTKGPMPDAFVWTGTSSAFRRAGFREVLRRSATRPIMRFVVRTR